MGAGAAYNTKFGGWISYATLINAKAQVYSFTTFDETITKAKPYLIISSVRSGVCTVMRNYGPLYMLGCFDVGTATSGSNVGGAYSGSEVTILRLGKTNWTIEAPIRYVKTTAPSTSQTIFEFGFGRTW